MFDVIIFDDNNINSNKISQLNEWMNCEKK